jgi:hypothetical protein
VTNDEVIALIDALRERGAVRVSVGDVHVEFVQAKPSAVSSEPPARVTPEERQRQAREEESKLLFAASG